MSTIKKQSKASALNYITVNNDSIAYIKMGEPNEAFTLLAEAVADLEQKVQLEEATQFDQTAKSFNFQWHDLENVYNCSDGSRTSKTPFLFKKLLAIDRPAKRELQEDFCPNRLLCVLKYNLAVVSHLLGIQQDGQKGQELLQEAARLYESLRTVIEVQKSPCAQCFMIQYLGVLNNQGCIYHELNRFDQAISCMSRLGNILKALRCSKSNPQLRYFFLNVMTLKQRTVAAAA